MAEPRTKEDMHANFLAARTRMEKAAYRPREPQAPSDALTVARTPATQSIPERCRIVSLEQQGPPSLPPVLTMRGSVNPARIIAETAIAHGLTPDEIKGPSRRKPIVAARFDAIRRVRTARPDLSLPSLGLIFGGRDHTTVLHALRKTEAA